MIFLQIFSRDSEYLKCFYWETQTVCQYCLNFSKIYGKYKWFQEIHHLIVYLQK